MASAECVADYSDNMPDILDNAPRMGMPVLVMRGDREPPDLYPAEDFAARCAGRCDLRILEDCDHFYTGREKAVSAVVAEWLRGVCTQGV